LYELVGTNEPVSIVVDDVEPVFTVKLNVEPSPLVNFIVLLFTGSIDAVTSNEPVGAEDPDGP
jgi:hypothetical protein